jgi:methanethiol S-methyltransferase
VTRILKAGFGLVSYLIFFLTFLYAIGFTAGAFVPKGIDDGEAGSLLAALAVNLVLLSLFAVQHSVMARPGFKMLLTRIVPKAIERSLFVLLASLVLDLLYWQWQPLPSIVWSLEGTPATLVWGPFWVGWGMVLLSTFLISHTELFGLRQVLDDWAGRSPAAAVFKTPSLYRLVRHPIYLGFIIAFWTAPVMSLGHLMFAAVTTAYILVGIQLEERDLLRFFGARYAAYRRQVSMLLPLPRRHPRLRRHTLGQE